MTYPTKCPWCDFTTEKISAHACAAKGRAMRHHIMRKHPEKWIAKAKDDTPSIFEDEQMVIKYDKGYTEF